MKKVFPIYFIIILACTILLLPSRFFVFSSNSFIGEVGGYKEEIDELNKQIEERKNKIAELEKSINQYKISIEEKKLEAVSLKNQLSILDNKISQTEVNIDLTEEKIKQAELEIEALELNIKEKESLIEKQSKIIAKIVRNIHTENQKNYIEILLTSESFADFYNQVKYLENVYTDLGKTVKTVKTTKVELEEKKDQADNRRKIYKDLKTELDDRRKDLVEQLAVKNNLLVTTQSSEVKYKSLLDSLKAQYQAIEGEVRSYEAQVRKKLAELEKNQSLPDDLGEFLWPVPSRYITAYFYDPTYPYKNIFEHSAIDLRAGQGTPVKATAAGYVARANRCTLASCYSYVLIVHSGDLSSLYGHLSSIVVTEDQFVGKGDIVGYSGGTPGTVGAGPFTTGPHLHFEIRKNGIPVNPLNYLN